MAGWLVQEVIKNMAQKKISISSAKVLIMGITFKEDCPDLRNSKVYDIFKLLKEYNINPTITDPIVDKADARRVYQINVHSSLSFKNKFDVIICAVPHKEYKKINLIKWESLVADNSLIVDIKGIVPRELNLSEFNLHTDIIIFMNSSQKVKNMAKKITKKLNENLFIY